MNITNNKVKIVSFKLKSLPAMSSLKSYIKYINNIISINVNISIKLFFMNIIILLLLDLYSKKYKDEY